MITQPSIQRLTSLDPELLKGDIENFLKHLGGPTWFEVEGRDKNRRRAIVTLLHGNEPSGLKAIHKLLREGMKPATNLGILVAAVDAALHPPLLSHRYIPGERDLNRCFALADGSNQAQLAASIAQQLNDYSPEAIIDTHNTSSHSEPFCVSLDKDAVTCRLAGLFANHLIVLRQKFGTLMEKIVPDIPVVTVEFGAFMDPDADRLAEEKLRSFAMLQELPQAENPSLAILDGPFRLETEHNLTVSYSSSVDENADLTMINSIDQFNFRELEPGQTLGWFGHEPHANLVVRDQAGENQYARFFDQSSGLLKNREPMIIFMATTDPVVANSDCLLYFSPPS